MKNFLIELYEEFQEDKTFYFLGMTAVLAILVVIVMAAIALIQYFITTPTAFFIFLGIALVVVTFFALPLILGKHFKASEDL